MKTKPNIPWVSIVGFIAIGIGMSGPMLPLFCLGIIVVIADQTIGSAKRSRDQKDEIIKLLREQNDRQNAKSLSW